MITYFNAMLFSMILLVMSLVVFRLMRRFGKRGTSIYILVLGVFIAIAVVFVPFYYGRENLHVIFASGGDTLRLFFLNSDFSGIWEDIAGISDTKWMFGKDYRGVFRIYTSFLSFAAPLLTISTLISLIAEFSVFARYYFKMYAKKHTYIFSELNNTTYEVASKIKKGANIVFTDVFAQNEEENYELRKKVENMGGLCLKRDIATMPITGIKGKKVSYFIWGFNEDENIEQAMGVYEMLSTKNKKSDVRINVYSTTEESQLIIDSINNDNKLSNIKIIRQNVYWQCIQDLYFKRPLFLGARDKKISVLVVGAGMIGEEAVKNALVMGQMYGYELEVNVVSKNAEDFKKRLAFASSELITDSDEYNINFYNIDVNSGEFREYIEKKEDINYVVISLGDDKVNVETAISLRMLFGRMDSHIDEIVKSKEEASPVINVFLESELRKIRVNKLGNDKGIKYNIYAFGIIDTNEYCYSDKGIGHKKMVCCESNIDPMYERLACCVNDAYFETLMTDEKQSLVYVYDQMSSYSSAVHAIYKLYYALHVENNMYEDKDFINEGPTDFYNKHRDMFIEYGKLVDMEADLHKDSLTLRLAIMEHMRWNAYMRTCGYIYADDEQQERYFGIGIKRDEQGNIVKRMGNKNSVARFHSCLVPWNLDSPKLYHGRDALDHVSDKFNELNRKYGKKTNEDYKYADVKIIAAITDIFGRNEKYR